MLEREGGVPLPNYKYAAASSEGKVTKGSLEAENVAELFQMLSEQGLHCIRYEDSTEESGPVTTYKMRLREVVIFCRQVETMISAGVTIARIFEILTDKTAKKGLKQLYHNVYEGLQTGNSLSSAMQQEGKSFPTLLIHMISSGEDSGTLEQVMRRMSVHFTNEMKLAARLKTAMIYPLILVAVSIAVVIILFTTVLPKLFGMFNGVDLPINTRILMWLSHALVTKWPFIIGVILLVIVGIYGIGKTEKGRLFFDHLKIKIPVFGKLMRTVYTARFASAMATLYASGITIIRALEISCEILLNSYYTHEFSSVISSVRSGQSLALAAEQTELFDAMFLSLIFIGEESGNLEDILKQASDYYDSEAQTAMERMIALFEPIMIVFLAVIIGFIVISVIMPIYGMYSNIA